MTPPRTREQNVRFGPVHATFDGCTVTLSEAPGDPEQTVSVSFVAVRDLAEAFERRDGLWMSSLDYEEAPDGTVTLDWFDYDIEERPIGGQVTIPAEHVPAVTAWLSGLELPQPPAQLAARAAEYDARRVTVRERAYGGLSDSVTHDDARYLLWARDGEHGLYGLPHADPADPARWLLRGPDGQLTAAGRPQAPDRHGRPRRWLHPRPPAGTDWLWVRTPPSRRR